MSICAYVWYKSYKSRATHSVGALWKVLVITLSCFFPVMVSPTSEETDSTAFPTFLVVKNKTSLNSAELNFPEFRELSWEGWRWKAWVGPRAFIPPCKDVEANVELKNKQKNFKYVDFTFHGYVFKTQPLFSSLSSNTSVTDSISVKFWQNKEAFMHKTVALKKTKTSGWYWAF